MAIHDPVVTGSPHWRLVRRLGAAGLAALTVLALGACKATGGGYIGAPLPGRVLPVDPPIVLPDGTYSGDANFGFTFTCGMSAANKAVIKGEITYHDTASIVEGVPFGEIRLHGVVDPVTLTAADCETAAQLYLDTALFDGTYRSQDPSLLSAVPGRFRVIAFDQGEPGRTTDPLFAAGDGFAIELFGGPYDFYTRGGYIEGGNIQVDNN
jgi:hypothetical protein